MVVSTNRTLIENAPYLGYFLYFFPKLKEKLKVDVKIVQPEWIAGREGSFPYFNPKNVSFWEELKEETRARIVSSIARGQEKYRSTCVFIECGVFTLRDIQIRLERRLIQIKNLDIDLRSFAYLDCISISYPSQIGRKLRFDFLGDGYCASISGRTDAGPETKDILLDLIGGVFNPRKSLVERPKFSEGASSARFVEDCVDELRRVVGVDL